MGFGALGLWGYWRGFGRGVGGFWRGVGGFLEGCCGFLEGYRGFVGVLGFFWRGSGVLGLGFLCGRGAVSDWGFGVLWFLGLGGADGSGEFGVWGLGLGSFRARGLGLGG